MFTDETLAVFLDELDEKIQDLDDNIMLLEQRGESSEVLQEIFRAAHTIKGSSAVMGYDQISCLTHEVESVFDLMRNGELHLSGGLIDTLFEALDTLKIMRDQILAGSTDDKIEMESLLADLNRYQGKEPDKLPGECFSGLVPEGRDSGDMPSAGIGGISWDSAEFENIGDLLSEVEIKGLNAFWIKIDIEPSCQMKGPRAFLVFKVLDEFGEIVQCDPPAEDLEEGRYDLDFKLVLITSYDEVNIHNALLTVAEIAKVTIKRLNMKDYELAANNGTGLGKKEAAATASGATKGGIATKGAAKKAKQVAGHSSNHTVRVDVRKLDTLLNLVGELVIDRTRLDRFVNIATERLGSDELVDSIKEISTHLGQISGDLQEEIMKARMLPVAQLFNRFPRMVRDIAQKLGKEINFVLEGKETELDRNVIEIITDPLIHLIRNAIDHGIESPEVRQEQGKDTTGLLRLAASYQESHIMLVIEDDGKGMDAQALREVAVRKGLLDQQAVAQLSEQESLELIFMPGFSSVGSATDLSGRGVGMDIVRTQIEQINGTIELETGVGKGTTITIKLPLTLVIIRALMIEVCDRVYAFPLANVYETIKVKNTDIEKVRHSDVIVVRGKVMPVVWLADVFDDQAKEEKEYLVVILGAGGKQIGVIVDALLGEQEIVIKSLGKYINQTELLSGATILGDGQVALIVDVRGLIKEVGTINT